MDTSHDVNGIPARPLPVEDRDSNAIAPVDPHLAAVVEALPQDGRALPRQLVLDAAQQQALDWLMGGGTISEAAEVAGVARQTVSRWVNHDPAFSWLYRQWQEQIRNTAEARMLNLADAAVENVIAAIREKNDLRASQFLLRLLGIGARSRRDLTRD